MYNSIAFLIALAAFMWPAVSVADPLLSFSPGVDVTFYPMDELSGSGLKITATVLHGDASHSAIGGGASDASWSYDVSNSDGYARIFLGGSAYASVDPRNPGMASADIFAEILFTIENISGQDRSYELDSSYGLSGAVSTAVGATAEKWSVGILYGDLLEDGSLFESQSHSCPPDADGSSCFNYYDYNTYTIYPTILPSVSLVYDFLIDLHLYSAVAPESPIIPIFLTGLIGLAWLSRFKKPRLGCRP